MHTTGDEDGTHAEETDARNHLRGNAERIGLHPQRMDDEKARHRRHRRAQTDEDMRAHPGGASLPFAVHTDHAAENKRQQQADGHGDEVKISEIFHKFFHFSKKFSQLLYRS